MTKQVNIGKRRSQPYSQSFPRQAPRLEPQPQLHQISNLEVRTDPTHPQPSTTRASTSVDTWSSTAIMAALNKIAPTSPSRQKPSELETSIAGAIYDLEVNIPDMKSALRPLQFVSAREVSGLQFQGLKAGSDVHDIASCFLNRSDLQYSSNTPMNFKPMAHLLTLPAYSSKSATARKQS